MIKNKKVRQWLNDLSFHKNKILFSIILLIIAIVMNTEVGEYADRVGSCASSDLILSFIHPINLGFIFVWIWMLVLLLLILYPLFARVSKLHEVIYYFSLVTIVRSIFVSFTHLRAPLDAVSFTFPWPFNQFVFQNDLFFSGHVALPLVGFFVFKGEKIRYMFLGLSILMAFTVLAMHRHYSIDVFAAYFIVYGTYKMGEWLTHKMKERNIKYF